MGQGGGGALGAPGRLLYASVTAESRARFADLEEDLGYYMTQERPTGVPAARLGLHLGIQGPLLDRKLVALRAMATQTSGLIAAVAPETYAELVAEEAFVAAAHPVAMVA